MVCRSFNLLHHCYIIIRNNGRRVIIPSISLLLSSLSIIIMIHDYHYIIIHRIMFDDCIKQIGYHGNGLWYVIYHKSLINSNDIDWLIACLKINNSPKLTNNLICHLILIIIIALLLYISQLIIHHPY